MLQLLILLPHWSEFCFGRRQQKQETLKNTKSISGRSSLIGSFQRRKKKNNSVPVPDRFPAWRRHLVALIVSQLVGYENDLVFEVVGRQRAALPRTEQGLEKKNKAFKVKHLIFYY